MKLKIVKYGDDLLRAHSQTVKNVNEDIISLVDGMFDSMYKNKGIGLAGVQVGKLWRVFITHVPDDKPRVFINPEIMVTSIEEVIFEEGCLSLPSIYNNVARSFNIQVQALDKSGKPFRLQADGMLARVILHEIDHLEGILFIDHLDKENKQKVLKSLKKKVIKK
jgi:peptide deformylase